MDASEYEGKAREPSKSHRFRKTAATVTHLCGLVLSRKRYIERSPVVQWATFQLKRQMNFKNDNLFSISDYSKKQFQKKGFEKLKHLLNICPKQRRQQDILKIQACLKTNRAFQCLPSKTQLQLCQAFIYQEYEAGTIIIRQGYVATECYLVLSGKLKIIMADAKFLTPEILYEAEEGDFIGETCLLTNTRRPATVICKSDAELVVIDKEDFKHILAELKCEQHHTTCHFLRKLPLFSTWLPGKIDFLLHCSLQRFYRAGTTVVIDSLNSYFLVIVKSGRSMEAAKLDPEIISTWNATLRMTPRYKSEKQKPQIAAVTYCSPEARKVFSEQENKGSEGKYDNGIKRIRRKTEVKVASLPPRFLKIRTLQQSDIFGLAEIMDRFCGLQLSLISEGAECVFIPKRLFLLEAPPKSKRIALEMASSYPQKNMIQESYIIQQLWSIYKSKLIGQHLESCARLASPSTSVW
ncbi:cyclic nucleotide-binding domain-containing protein 2-like isoform X2 [Rhineura floridana]|uniref:cyclic nucleotide-binding domain-containing protein 2-like isoform X2 n=1 Tax=Rhineura floridana TaxID=261503 RepID=UPI002AC81391|nr:cyclic nucleotide-binding domain-containing protein 2-like isoform X2 [Rhineura floridana]XP_061440614.1 cyclic nucleotide-binding domain-containing protein 2-like isoform X2 [Rhineura floridana]